MVLLNNIISGPGNFYDLKSGCEGFTTAVDDERRVMPGTLTSWIP